MNQLSTGFVNLLQHISKMLLGIVEHLGPFFVALMPASFSGYSVFVSYYEASSNFHLAVVFGFIVACGLEAIGIKAAYTVIRVYSGYQIGQASFREVVMAILFSLAYVIPVMVSVGFAKEEFSNLVYWLGFWSPVLTMVMYLTSALDTKLRTKAELEHKEESTRINLERERLQLEEEQKQREFERELKRKELEYRHEETMAGKIPEISASQQEIQAERWKLKPEKRQEKVRELFKQGRKQKEIAEALGVTARTIRNDIKALNGNLK